MFVLCNKQEQVSPNSNHDLGSDNLKRGPRLNAVDKLKVKFVKSAWSWSVKPCLEFKDILFNWTPNLAKQWNLEELNNNFSCKSLLYTVTALQENPTEIKW